MIDPKVKPSIAARELGKKIREKYIVANPQELRDEIALELAEMCQSALCDLLTQAQYVVDAGPNEVVACQHFFAIALEPWKTTI